MKALAMFLLFLPLALNAKVEGESFYTFVLDNEAKETAKMDFQQPTKVKKDNTKQKQKKDIFSIKEFESLTKARMSY